VVVEVRIYYIVAKVGGDCCELVNSAVRHAAVLTFTDGLRGKNSAVFAGRKNLKPLGGQRSRRGAFPLSKSNAKTQKGKSNFHIGSRKSLAAELPGGGLDAVERLRSFPPIPAAF
jgi:hypothetical protein